MRRLPVTKIPRNYERSFSYGVCLVQAVMALEVFKYNFLNFYIAKPVQCTLLKSVQMTLSK